MKVKQENIGKFDVARIKASLIEENKYIINVWSRVPGQQSADSKEGDESIIVKDSKTVRAFGSGTRAKTIEELYSKLEVIKGRRLQYKERLLKKGIKNKMGKKKRKEERKHKKVLIKMNKQTPNVKMEDVKPAPSKPAKPVFNSEGKIVFSKFDFTESSANDGPTKKDKEARDPRKLLKKLEKQNEKYKNLEEQGETEKLSEIKEKQAWKTALQKAGGVKVKDDPDLLKKSLRNKQQQKNKSRKKWEARESQLQKKMEEKQKKRQANIDEVRRKKKAKKMKKLVKRGRVIPGC